MGFFDRLKEGLKKTRANFTDSMDQIFNSYERVDEDFYEELEETMIMGDIGVKTTQDLLDHLREEVRAERIKYAADCRQELILGIRNRMKQGKDAYDFEKGPAVVLVIGVNGVGKTTSIGKLAANYKKQGKRVLIASADTFRAAAVQQLCVWCDRIGVEIIKSENKAPATVAYETVNKAISEDFDMVFIDTAGRLQNNNDLMNELVKMKRVVAKVVPCENIEVVIVLDASIGQNATSQLDLFNKAIGVDGIVLTKTDGLAKGGFIIGLINDFHIPIKYIGYGENLDDIRRFDVTEYAKAFVG